MRKAWANWEAREESPAYGTSEPLPLFHQETLEVYGASLKLIEWFVRHLQTGERPNRLQRQIDESLTSIVLNIAEGNGRYSELDHHRFLDLAAGAAVKTAAFLDLAVQRGVLDPAAGVPSKDLLRPVVAMLSRM